MMLERVKAAFTNPAIPDPIPLLPGQIKTFYVNILAQSTLLCRLGYTLIELAPGQQDKYQFLAMAGTPRLTGVVIQNGVADNFSIDGINDLHGTYLVPGMIKGSVGNLSSKSDIRFNNVNWVIDSVVTLQTLVFYIR